MDVPAVVVDRPADEEKEHSAIFRLEEERLGAVCLRCHVIDRAWLLDPGGTAHPLERTVRRFAGFWW